MVIQMMIEVMTGIMRGLVVMFLRRRRGRMLICLVDVMITAAMGFIVMTVTSMVTRMMTVMVYLNVHFKIPKGNAGHKSN
jgi:hypothetical protein